MREMNMGLPENEKNEMIFDQFNEEMVISIVYMYTVHCTVSLFLSRRLQLFSVHGFFGFISLSVSFNFCKF